MNFRGRQLGCGLAGVKATKPVVVGYEVAMELPIDEVDVGGFELVNSFFCEQVDSGSEGKTPFSVNFTHQSVLS